MFLVNIKSISRALINRFMSGAFFWQENKKVFIKIGVENTDV